MKTAIQFGAGNIGRGFLGQLFSQSGYRVVFVDLNEELITLINNTGAYPLRIVRATGTRRITVDNVCAVHADDVEGIAEEIANADIMATAVGKRAFNSIAPLIASGIERRISLRIEDPLNIIICENLFHGADTLRECILENKDEQYQDYGRHHLGLVESVVSRMVPGRPEATEETDPLLITAEEYSVLPVDKKAFVGDIPPIDVLQPCDNLPARQEQKMFTHNTGHSLLAYLGYLKGYKYIHEAVRDGCIRDITLGALGESGRALIIKHKIDAQEHQHYVENLLERFNNVPLADTVSRGAKDPIRKLGAEDRLVGAAKLALEYGVRPDYLALGIAAAFDYDNVEDEQAITLSQIKRQGVDNVLADVCNLDPKEELSLLIKDKQRSDWKIRHSAEGTAA